MCRTECPPRVVPTKYGLKHLLDRSVRERAEDGWSEWRDPATGQLFYVEMATGESQWAPPEVFAPTMVCEWQGCGLKLATANQLQDHQLVDHHWVCFACREDNAIWTYPRCPKCGNQLDEEGRTMLEMKKDKAREEELVRLAQRRRDMLAAHRARQVASVPSGADVERLKSKAWARRSKSRGEGTARGITPRDGEHGLGTRPGSSFRSTAPHRPPGHGSSHRSIKRAASGRGRQRTHTAPAAAATPHAPGAGPGGSAGAGAGGGSGAGAVPGAAAGAAAAARAGGAPEPAVAVVEAAGLLDWGDDARLFAAADRDTAAHVPSALGGPELPEALRHSDGGGSQGSQPVLDVAAGAADGRGSTRDVCRTPGARGSPASINTGAGQGSVPPRLSSPARSVRFRVITPPTAPGSGEPGRRSEGGSDGSGSSRSASPPPRPALKRGGGGSSPLHRKLMAARDAGLSSPAHTLQDREGEVVRRLSAGPETGDDGGGTTEAGDATQSAGGRAPTDSADDSRRARVGVVADGSMPVALADVSKLRGLPPVKRLNSAMQLQPVVRQALGVGRWAGCSGRR